MDGLQRPLCRYRFVRGAVRVLAADLPLEIVNGSPLLPGLVLWALSLNAGDLLIGSPSRGGDRSGWNFESYLERVNGSVQTGAHPWPYIEEAMLPGAMGAVGPNGAVRLPDEAAVLVRPGGSVRLRVEDHPGRRPFTLSAERERFSSPRFFARAEYLLPVEPDLKVSLPAEALWALGLAEGDRLDCKAFLAEAGFAPAAQRKGSGKPNQIDLGPGGTLALPDSMRVSTVLRPQARVRLIVTLSPRPAFRITQWGGCWV
jgi:hypothetical protein